MSRRPILMSTHPAPSSRRAESNSHHHPTPSTTGTSVYNGLDPHAASTSWSDSRRVQHARVAAATAVDGFGQPRSARSENHDHDGYRHESPMEDVSACALQFGPSFDGSQPKQQQQQQQQQQHYHNHRHMSSPSWEEKKDAASDTPSLRCTPSPPSSLVNLRRRGGSRIVKLSSIFGGNNQQANSKNKETAAAPVASASSSAKSHYFRKQQQQPPAPAPPSPPPSSSSGGYVGWPGTLDSSGQTVHVQSSYEESSVGGGAPLADSSYEEEAPEHAAVKKGVERWNAVKTLKPGVPNVDTSLDGSTTTANSSFSKSPATHTPPTRDGRLEQQPSRIRQQQREQYDQSFDLADAIAGTNRYQPSSTPLKGEPRAYAQTDVGQQQPRMNVRSLLQRREAAEPQGIMITGSTTKEADDFVPFDNLPFDHQTQEIWNTNQSSSGEDAVMSRSITSNNGASMYSDPVDYNFLYGARGGFVDEITVAPTREALAANDRVDPPHRAFANAQGYRGLMEKTRDVPCLMDEDSESMTSSKATSTFSSLNQTSTLDPPARSYSNFVSSPQRRAVAFDDYDEQYEQSPRDDDSDVFDGVSARDSDVFDDLSHIDGQTRFSLSPRRSTRSRSSYPESIAEEEEEEDVQIVLLGGGLTAIQTSKRDFAERKTASDYDETLTNSDVDQFGFSSTPAFEDMIVAGLKQSSSLLGIQGNTGLALCRQESASGPGSSLFSDPYEHDRSSPFNNSLSEFAVVPAQMKLLMRTYRAFCDKVNLNISLEAFEKEEDEHKAFALFEMRSRIMEKDIERGLERRGGTVVVDDIVLTAYNRAAHRIRDAVIVSKAWRDGTSPRDVITSAMLTRRQDHVYYIRRASHPDRRMNGSMSSNDNFFPSSSPQNWWEPVEWMDDTSFSQFRCPSLGFRHMRGVEMFTIGDCQSMLLKLSNERCAELRSELNEATSRQLEAEELLAAEEDAEDGLMTEAEMDYLGSMEEVKTISKDLVQAEQSFNHVRERIENLVHKYEQLLDKIDTESFAGASSVMTYESSYVSEHDSAYWHAMEERERAVWARRAQRAEVKAQIAAREALLLKQQARMFQEQKQRELEELQQKLYDLQSESSFSPIDRRHTSKLAQNFAMYRHDEVDDEDHHGEGKSGQNDKDSVEEVKQRFRERMKDRMQQKDPAREASSGRRFAGAPNSVKRHIDPALRDLFRSAGEEMYQQLDFYERSLRAVAIEPNS